MIPKIKKILYATDLSKNSSYAFIYAVDMARGNGARIVILHSVEPLRSMSYAYSGAGYSKASAQVLLKEDERQEQNTELKEIRKRVEEFCTRMDAYMGSSCSELVSKVLVPVGHPVEEILEAANEEGCDAIVLGTHGKGFLKQTFLGSTAVKVLERTRKPVFIIPLPSEKADVDWEKI
jgi:nucleotide-binding universal stress UspA family protein